MAVSKAAEEAIREASKLFAIVKAGRDCGGYAFGELTAISLRFVPRENERDPRVDVSIQALGHVLVPWERFEVTMRATLLGQKDRICTIPMNSHGYGYLSSSDLNDVETVSGIEVKGKLVGGGEKEREAAVSRILAFHDLPVAEAGGRVADLAWAADGPGSPVTLLSEFRMDLLLFDKVQAMLIGKGESLDLILTAEDLNLEGSIVEFSIESNSGRSAPGQAKLSRDEVRADILVGHWKGSQLQLTASGDPSAASGEKVTLTVVGLSLRPIDAADAWSDNSGDEE